MKSVQIARERSRVPTRRWHMLAALFVTGLALPRVAVAARPLVVGDGTAASCTELALRDAVSMAGLDGGGIIRFRCGDAPVTIEIATLEDPGTRIALTVPDSTTIEGEGLVTLKIAGAIYLDRDASAVLKSLTILGIDPFHHHDGRVVNSGTGTLTITNSVFSNYWGNAVSNDGTLNVKNSVFTSGHPGLQSAIIN